MIIHSSIHSSDWFLSMTSSALIGPSCVLICQHPIDSVHSFPINFQLILQLRSISSWIIVERWADDDYDHFRAVFGQHLSFLRSKLVNFGTLRSTFVHIVVFKDEICQFCCIKVKVLVLKDKIGEKSWVFWLTFVKISMF